MSVFNTSFLSRAFLYFESNMIQNWVIGLREKETLYIICPVLVLRLPSFSSLDERRPLRDQFTFLGWSLRPELKSNIAYSFAWVCDLDMYFPWELYSVACSLSFIYKNAFDSK